MTVGTPGSSDEGGFAAVFSHDDGEAVVTVRGEIDLANADALEAVLAEAMRASDRLVLDFRLVTFMDSTGLNVLVRAHQDLGDRPGAAVVIRHAPVTVRKLLRITGVDAYVQLDG